MFRIKNASFLGKALIVSVFVSTIFSVASASAYTVTFNSTFGEFADGSTTNVVEYNDQHQVVSGEYKEPIYNTGVDSSDFITWYSEYDAKNRVNIDEITSDTTVYAAYEKITWRWDYTGGEQSFSLPITAGLQLHVWGAQGGTIPGPLSINEGTATIDEMAGGYGGYSTGLYDFLANQSIYINVGGQGSLNRGRNTISDGGYNGGGTGGVGNAGHLTNARSTGGGGATHIATESGILSTLEGSKDSVAIVAGGGGGKYYFRYDTWYAGPYLGHGGGFKGGYAFRWGTRANGNKWLENIVPGGSQTTAGSRGSFGQGGNIPATGDYGEQGGGGGGWYGGGSATFSSAGGSGYIGNNIETTRHMAIYVNTDVPGTAAYQPSTLVSDDDQTKTIITYNAGIDPIEDYAKLGNGYAKAELTRLTITYVNDFGADTNTVKDQYVGSLAQELPLTPRTGYTVAWYNGDTKWNFDDPVNFDLTLTAKYTPIVYNLSYDLNDGSVITANPTTYTIESDSITLTNPTKDYYTFIGWSGTDLTGDENTAVTIPTGSYGDRSFVANFTPTDYAITYNIDETVDNKNNPTKYNYESGAITLARPSKEGFNFIGWSGTDLSDDPENYALDVVIPANSHIDREYTPHFEINQYTATFDVNGGSDINPATRTLFYGTALGELPETSRTGYKFDGWFTGQNDGNRISADTKMPATNPTYFAHWTPIQYTFHFDANTGEGSMANEVYDYDETKPLTALAFTKLGYTFTGWDTEVNGGGDTYTDGQNIHNLTIEDGKEYTLYAQWSRDTYTIDYNLNDSETDATLITSYNVESDDIVLPTPTRKGYKFLGWSGTDITDKAENVTIPTGSTGNRSYTANWETIEYRITYDMDGHTNASTNPGGYTVTSPDIALAAPTAKDDYYYFVGWALDRDTEDGITKDFIIPTGSTGDITVYAIFQQNPYTVTFDSDGAGSYPERVLRGDAKIGELPTPEKAGYKFLGWFVDGEKIDEDFHSRYDVTAVAHWELISVEPETPNTGDNIQAYLMTFAVCLMTLLLVSKLRPAAIRKQK